MARLKYHTTWKKQESDGTVRLFRQMHSVPCPPEVFRIAITDDRFTDLKAKLGKNKAMAEIQKWLKDPTLIGEYYWAVERPKAIAFYFTQWTTAFAFKMAWM